MPKFENTTQLIESAIGHDWYTYGDSYLLLDGARLGDMVTWLRRQNADVRWISLLGTAMGSTLLEASPVLVHLPVSASDRFLRRLLNDPKEVRAVSFLVSQQPLRQLADHLTRHLYIEDPDGARWMLAYWDPFILSSLVGSRPSISALVPGPILTEIQRAALLAPVAWWCFRGRDNTLCTIRSPSPAEESARPPFAMTQEQMNQLADLSLPDQVGKVLTEAAPETIASLSDTSAHRIFCHAIRESRWQNNDTLAAYCAFAMDVLEKEAPIVPCGGWWETAESIEQ